MSNVGRQFQTLLYRKFIHRALEFNNAHYFIIMLGLCVYSRGNFAERHGPGREMASSAALSFGGRGRYGNQSDGMADVQDLKIHFGPFQAVTPHHLQHA